MTISPRTLRITQTREASDRHRVEIVLEGAGLVRQTASASFAFQLTPQDREDLRWYLEDYLQFPHDPAPTIAARIEQRLADIGGELFQAVFQASEQGRRLWGKVYERLNDLRVEVVTSVREAVAIPWELVRDPFTDTVLALHAAAFVRTYSDPLRTPRPIDPQSRPIRVLLVICRPKLGDDAPFRSVASRLVKALSDEARAIYKLDVLRPPTYAQLAKTLRAAKSVGQPYHVVHFDGHGMYAEVPESSDAARWLSRLVPLMLSGPRTGPHGYLLFENPASGENIQLVAGPTLGNLLVETGAPVLVLNACRSAHADAPAAPQPTEGEAGSDVAHTQIRAFGSLAQEVIDAGVTGVVAMRYNVYVVTAAQFVADLYSALVQGATLGEAVTLGRKQLAANPERTIAFAPRPLQDWSVPLVYEALPTALFPKQGEDPTLSITIDAASASAEVGSLDAKLPKPPDAGFFGRDETLLALDRAFDSNSIVLLHAYAGSGKTATAVEFARWYAQTGGVQGPVLFTTFEQYTPLPRVLDRIGDVFGATLERSGVNWLALDDDKRRDMALQVLKQIPVLWIWNNVEPVAGFPSGSQSVWSDVEQQELADFLRDAAHTKAMFLLTSRRDERAWLGETLPRRIAVPPMPTQERVQLARALAERQGRRLTDVDDWRPLLRFTAGNPLTITVLVGQALRDGLKTREQIESFVELLRRGEAAFEDEETERRDRSLAASLSYGFEHTFDEHQRQQLALLHFFHGFVDIDVLWLMGNPDAPWSLPAVRGLNRETWNALLTRTAEVGLLTSLGGGYYTIHPALPWFFQSLCRQYYGQASDLPMGAFVRSMSDRGCTLHNRIQEGERDLVLLLGAEEMNLLVARREAWQRKWWRQVVGTMQGLHMLYESTGRHVQWARLVD